MLARSQGAAAAASVLGLPPGPWWSSTVSAARGLGG